MEPGTSVGILMSQSICESSTQSLLSSFHNAGAKTDTRTNVKKFENILNVCKTFRERNCFVFGPDVEQIVDYVEMHLVAVSFDQLLVGFNLAILESSTVAAAVTAAAEDARPEPDPASHAPGAAAAP